MTEQRGRDAVSYMCKHLVALVGDYRSIERDGTEKHRGVLTLSGFIIEIMGKWYWTTAGHCLRTLDRWITRCELDVTDCAFADYWGLEAEHHHAIPYTYEVGCGFYIERESLGLDFGVIPLPDLFRLNMEANEVAPIGRANWAKVHELEFMLFKMLGFPSMLKQESKDADGHVVATFGPAMLTVEQLSMDQVENPPPGDWFVGRIHPDVALEDIQGMSGGPIYGFRKLADGQMVYHVVAVQSWWRPEKRIIFGCSLRDCAEALHKAIEEHGQPA